MRIPAPHVDFDEGNAGFDQTARHQAAATEGGFAIFVLHSGRLGIHFKCGHLLTRHQIDCLLKDLEVIVGFFATMLVDEIFFIDASTASR